METAESAGTVELRSSPISLIDSEDEGEYRYMFCVRFSIDGPSVDMFFDACRNMKWSEIRSRYAAQKLSGVADTEVDALLNYASTQFFVMGLRARANAGSVFGPCFLVTENPLDVDQLEDLLRFHAERHTLKDFLHRLAVK